MGTTDSVLGIAGGVALGFFGGKLVGGSSKFPVDIEAAAARITAYDTYSQVFLHRKPLFSYIGSGITRCLYAFTVTLADESWAKDDPSCIMSVVIDPSSGKAHYEFGGMGPACDIYLDSNPVPKLTTPGSVSFIGG